MTTVMHYLAERGLTVLCGSFAGNCGIWQIASTSQQRLQSFIDINNKVVSNKSIHSLAAEELFYRESLICLCTLSNKRQQNLVL